MAGPPSETQLARMQAYWDAANYLVVREHFDDMPEVRDWTWTD